MDHEEHPPEGGEDESLMVLESPPLVPVQTVSAPGRIGMFLSSYVPLVSPAAVKRTASEIAGSSGDSPKRFNNGDGVCTSANSDQDVEEGWSHGDIPMGGRDHDSNDEESN